MRKKILGYLRRRLTVLAVAAALLGGLAAPAFAESVTINEPSGQSCVGVVYHVALDASQVQWLVWSPPLMAKTLLEKITPTEALDAWQCATDLTPWQDEEILTGTGISLTTLLLILALVLA